MNKGNLFLKNEKRTDWNTWAEMYAFLWQFFSKMDEISSSGVFSRLELCVHLGAITLNYDRRKTHKPAQ